jgi:CBS domain containing-hemolysin-like protein
MESLAEKGDPRAIKAFGIQKNLDQAVAATQLGITFASISLGSVGEVTMASILHRAIDPIMHDFVGQIALHSFCSTVAVIAVSFMHLIFGELIPKTIAIQSPDRIVLVLSSPMHWFLILSRPIVWGMNGTGNFLLKLVGFKNPGIHAHAHSVEELLMIVEDTEEAAS